MKVVCAWCRKELRPAAQATPVSHGICPSCAAAFEHPEAEAITRFLDGFGFPVAVVDPAGVVRSLNAKAEDLVGKTSGQAAGKPGGVVFSCRNAGLPGGCGKTVHCKTCTVRGAVTETAETGRALERGRAFIDQDGRRLNLVISTEKVGGMVLLRVDEARADA